MAKLTIMGRDFEIAPYKIAQMRRAAPYIDRINASVGAMTTIEGMTEAAADFCGFLSIGIMKADPAISLDMIEDAVGVADVINMRDAFNEILIESGLIQGEVKAPTAAEPEGASTTASETSSTT